MCRHRLQTPADSPNRCGCRSIRVQTLDDAVGSQIRAALTAARHADPAKGRPRAGDADNGARIDIGADTLAPRIADAAQHASDLQATIATEYQAGFDPATAQLMLQARREQLTHAQNGLHRLQRIRETLTHTAESTVADHAVLAKARARIDDLDLPGKQQLLDLMSVKAQLSGYRECPTCAGTGYQPISADYDRRWPPSCPSCHRLHVLPDVTVHIGAAELLAPIF